MHILNPKENNQAEFAELIDPKILNSIYNLAYRISGNAPDAEDIVQDVFIQAYLNLPQFKGESALSTWLYTMTKNQSLRHLQKKGRISFSALEDIIHSVTFMKEDPDFEAVEKQYYIDQVKEGCLLGLLRCLSLQQRIAFILHVFLEVPTADIASILGKSENAARILTHRAKQNIKNFLCRNCSLYDESNPCHCEYLINFSLKNNWITTYPSSSQTENFPRAGEIEKELKAFKKVVSLYQSLPEHPPGSTMVQMIKNEIKHNGNLIFSAKKVK